MRADDGALAALDALRGIPSGDERRNVALLPLGGGGGPRAVVGDGGDGQVVALLGDHLGGDLLDELGSLVRDDRGHLDLAGGSGGVLDLLDGGRSGLDALPVHLHDFLALLGVRLLGVVLEHLDRVELGAVGLGELDAGELEERGLENRVRARAHAVLAGDLRRVDHVELELLVDDRLLDLVGHVVPDLVRRERRGEEEHGARLRGLEHVVLLEVREAVARREVGRVDEVGRADHVAAEAEVRDRDAAGLLGVVLEVALRVVLGVVADDLDGVLVRADRAVRAEAPEHALLAVALRHHKGVVAEQIAAGDVVDDAHHEVVERLLLCHVREDVRAHLGSEVLGADAVAAGEDLRVLEGDDTLLLGLADRGARVEVERVTDGARLLRAVQHRDALHGLRNRLHEVLH